MVVVVVVVVSVEVLPRYGVVAMFREEGTRGLSALLFTLLENTEDKGAGSNERRKGIKYLAVEMVVVSVFIEKPYYY